MEFKVEEFSNILQKTIENFHSSAELKEVGEVIKVGDGIAKVYGLDIAEGGLAGVGEWLQCDVSDDASVKAAFVKISITSS